MKSILKLTTYILVFCAACLSPLAQSANDVFQLPDGQAREAYRVDIEAVLRERYRQKIDTGVNGSILQWSIVDGELPAGMTVRTDGNVVGTPETAREKPYMFRVAVVDRAVANSSPLLISLGVVIGPPRLRLNRIEGPALVPMDGSSSTSRGRGPQVTDVSSERSGPDVSRRPVETPQPAVKTRNHLPAQADAAALPSGSRGILKKIAGMVGVQGGDSSRDPRGCEPGSDARRQVSDELRNALEGDTSTQNTCVEFRNLNRLKYRFDFNTKTTRSEGPDISGLPFLPKVSLTTSTPPTPPSDPAPSDAFLAARTGNLAPRTAGEKAANERAVREFKDDIAKLNRAFNEARIALNNAETTLREKVETVINQNNTALEDAHAQAKGLANDADDYLRANNAKGLLEQVGILVKEIDKALNKQWPAADILTVLSILDDVTARLEDLRGLASEDVWKEWLVANQDRYNRVRDRVTELRTKASSLNSNDFEDGKRVLAGWQRVVKSVQAQGENAFNESVFVSCHTDEAETKSSKLSITKVDRTIEDATAVTREVLTVHCYSRVTLTAGFNFSTLDEKEFSVVQSAGAESGSTIKTFGFTNRSSFRPNPLALLNFRFTDHPTINWHASFGAVVDLKGQTGTDVEPVAGVSFSIRRLIFITPFALHFGRVNKLAGGFKEGDVVPDSIATPPVEKAWKVGYTGGITFRIAPQ